MEEKRRARRALAAERKADMQAEKQRNRENGVEGDADFMRMIREFRSKAKGAQDHAPPGETKICICVRKRPISGREIDKKEHDAISCTNPTVVVHDCKFKASSARAARRASAFAPPLTPPPSGRRDHQVPGQQLV